MTTENEQTPSPGTEYKVSKRWDDSARTSRQVSDAEREYRQTLKQRPQQTKPLSVEQVKAQLHKMITATCPGFEYTEANKALLNSLSYYVADDYRFPHTAYDLSQVGGGKSINRLKSSKGILVFGRYGVGKTTIVQSVARLMKAKRTTAMQIVEDFNGQHSLRKYEQGHWYIDDLGREREPQYARKGDPKIMADLLERRYFIGKGKTLVTTNLSIEDMKEMYGPRVESRLWEMFNMYALGGLDYRKV